MAEALAEPSPTKCAEDGKKGLSIVHTTLDLYKRQLLPGAKFDTFSKKLKFAVFDGIDVTESVNDCRHLGALDLGVMRVVNGASPLRKVGADTLLGDDTLRICWQKSKNL
ncbi:MAG: hypothetical protein Q9226_006606 [Calogaya cf. arnoldii]